jgi:hypothetical protein
VRALSLSVNDEPAPRTCAAWAQQAGLNLLVLDVPPQAALDQVAAWLDAAAAVGLGVALRAEPGDAHRAAQALVQRCAAHPALTAWAVTGDAREAVRCFRAARPARPVLGWWFDADASAAHAAGVDVLVGAAGALYQPALSYGGWARWLAAQRASFGGPVLAAVECTPPADSAPLTCGEAALVPEPAQIRLQTLAALGAGARGVVFGGARHLFGDGPLARAATDRAAAVVQLAEELRRVEPWLAAGEPLFPLVASPGLAAGQWRLGERRLVVSWRDRRLDSRLVGAAPVSPAWVAAQPAPGPRERVDLLTPTGLLTRGADQRLSCPEVDLGALWVLGPAHEEHTAWRTATAQGLAGALPAVVARSVLLAGARLAKVESTVRRLEAVGRSAGGRAPLAAAHTLLLEATEAQRYGYLQSAWDLATAAERLTRSAQALEFEAALTAAGTGGGALPYTTFATLPHLFERR